MCCPVRGLLAFTVSCYSHEGKEAKDGVILRAHQEESAAYAICTISRHEGINCPGALHFSGPSVLLAPTPPNSSLHIGPRSTTLCNCKKSSEQWQPRNTTTCPTTCSGCALVRFSPFSPRSFLEYLIETHHRKPQLTQRQTPQRPKWWRAILPRLP